LIVVLPAPDPEFVIEPVLLIALPEKSNAPAPLLAIIKLFAPVIPPVNVVVPELTAEVFPIVIVG